MPLCFKSIFCIVNRNKTPDEDLFHTGGGGKCCLDKTVDYSDFYPCDVVSTVYATATWLAVCHSRYVVAPLL